MARISLLLLLVLALLAGPCYAESLAVIVSKDNPNAVDVGLIRKIYLGNVTRWPSGGVIAVQAQPEDSPAAATFASKVLGKPVSAVRDIWAQNVFTGKAMPPKVHASDDSIKRIVGRSKNAIGYISAGEVDSSVRVVYTTK